MRTPSSAPAPTRQPRRHRRRAILAFVLVVLVVVAAVLALPRRRQIFSFLTHWKGSPRHTEAYVPFAAAPDFHLAVAGDVGDSGSRLRSTGVAIARLGAASPYDVLLLLGDNVYPSGDPAKLPSTVFEPFSGVLDEGTALLAILGNHDVKQGNGPAQMTALGMPGRFWAKRYGEVLLVGLDSNDLTGGGQLDFLRSTLAETDARWKIVAVHHPPYSAGYQGSSIAVREALAPLLEQYGVQLVLSGHDHDYQRSKPINGVTYVVSGAASGTRRTGAKSFTAVSFSWHHFLDVNVFADRLVVRAVNQDGRVADEAVLTP